MFSFRNNKYRGEWTFDVVHNKTASINEENDDKLAEIISQSID